MIPVGITLQANLNSQTPRLATCWLIVRTDGQRFAFTSWDQSFTYSMATGTGSGYLPSDPFHFGTHYQTDTYLPVNSMDSSANASKTDLSVTNATTTTIYSDTLTERDLKGGLFDDARVKVFWIDPFNVDAGYVPIQGGRLGQMVFKNVSFECELRSSAQVLQQSFGRVYALECYADYGDEFCQHLARAKIWRPEFTFSSRTNFNIVVRPTVYNGFWYTSPAAGGVSALGEPTWPLVAGHTVADGDITWTAISAPYSSGAVTAISNRAKFSDSVNRTEADAFWQYGQILWLTGDNAGLQMEVSGFENTGGVIYLLEPMPNKIQAGDQYVILDGCEKTRTACVRKSNLVNFQGFPDMPTEAQALSTPNFANPDSPQPSPSSGS